MELPAAFAAVASGRANVVSALTEAQLEEWAVLKTYETGEIKEVRGNLLHWSARHGNVPAVTALLSRGVAIDSAGSKAKN